MEIQRPGASHIAMKPEERKRMYELCDLIEKETNHAKAIQLIEELNQLLEPKIPLPETKEEI